MKLKLGKTELKILAKLEDPWARKIGRIGVDTTREMNAARALEQRGLVRIESETDWAWRNRGQGRTAYCQRVNFVFYRVYPVAS